MSQSKKDILDQLNKVIKACERCRLCFGATQAVPGEGSPYAKVMFVGEAPGFYEDKEGRPFVGRAGQLLTRLFLGIGWERKDVFITNVVKHRPPDNRAPNKDEIRACLPYLERQIQVINPKVIVPLGRHALEIFVKGKTITEAAGNAFEVGGRVIYPMFHPAAALRSTSVAKQLKRDFTRLPSVLNGKVKTQVLDTSGVNENQMRLV